MLQLIHGPTKMLGDVLEAVIQCAVYLLSTASGVNGEEGDRLVWCVLR